ncbi:S24 family peptidase [Psychrobacter sp.]|uniref:S24 family peptidase n=1 Tax=Psychrobacter sp. TaxID=56811 RepID=UPI003569827F
MSATHPTMARVFEQTGLEPSALALKINASPQNVTNWSKRGISKKGAMDVSRVFGLSLDWVLTGAGEPKKPSRDDLMQQIKDIENGSNNPTPQGTVGARMSSSSSMVPILSWVAAGSWSNTEPVTMDDVIGEAPRPPNLSKLGFALRVQGRSMMPEFKPDDVIYVEPQTGLFALKDSDLVVVQCNDDKDATFKQLVIGETYEDMYLKPLNPDWHEQKMLPMGECNLVGKVVGKYAEY